MESTTFQDDATIASRYLGDRLNDGERDAYETHLKQNPEAMRELEATARLKLGLLRLRESGELDGLMRESNSFRSPFVMALAAGVAALAIGVGLWHSGAPGVAPILSGSAFSLLDPGGHALPITRTQVLFRKRSNSYDAIIDLPETGGTVQIRVLPETRAAIFGASLTRIQDDGSEQAVASVSDLKTAQDGSVNLYADSSRLSEGRYRLTVRPADAENGSAESFVLKLRAYGAAR
jgi:hypothetical protein